MNKQKLISVTIGIPAHNEEQNIENLLKSLDSQKINGFSLDRIIVVCDGCTDSTAKIANSHKSKWKVQVYNDGKRLGKLKRLEWVYRTNKSDVILILDGDVLPKGDNFVFEMLNSFSQGIGIVGGNSQTIKPESQFGLLLNSWSSVWKDIRHAYKSGSNVYNSRGCCLALTNEFAKTVKFPINIYSDSSYLFFAVLKKGLKFKFSPKAIVYYRKPENVSDYLSQSTRAVPEKPRLAELFGEQVYLEYKIPLSFKLLSLIRSFLKDPINVLLGMLLNYSILIYTKFGVAKYSNKITWSQSISTKKAITLN